MAELGVICFNVNFSSGSTCRFHPGLLSLASGSWVSLLPRREDMQIPLPVSCQDFFWMCQATLLVFAGGIGLYLYYIVILGKVALTCLIFPLFFFPYFHCLESRDSPWQGES